MSSFDPVVGESPRVLILGSMPSVRSLQEGQYYAHPRNAFWSIMENLGLARVSASYADRIEELKQSGVALWDSLRSCNRRGSLDANIVSSTEQANDFETFFSEHVDLRAVFFNGTKAEQIFRRYVLPTLPERLMARRSFQRLPSTSPAHAIPFERKLAAWSAVLGPLSRHGDPAI